MNNANTFIKGVGLTPSTLNNVVTSTTLNASMDFLPLLGGIGASIVLLLATSNANVEMTSQMKAYSNSVAAISIILSTLLLVRLKQTESIDRHIRRTLFIWSFVGACILTFGTGPFSKTGNGYFACWAKVIFTFFSSGINYSRVKSALMDHASPLTGLGFCSFLVLIAAFPYINTEYKWQSMTASIVSGASLLIIIFYLYKHQQESRLPTESFVVLLLLSLFWIFTAGVTTFSGPFLVTGNGYFASWGGAILSVVVTKDAYQDGINQTEIPPSPRFAETEEGTGPV